MSDRFFFTCQDDKDQKVDEKREYCLTEICGGRHSHALLGATRESNMGNAMKIIINIPVDLTIIRTKKLSNRRHQ